MFFTPINIYRATFDFHADFGGVLEVSGPLILPDIPQFWSCRHTSPSNISSLFIKIYLVTFKMTYPKRQTDGHSSQADKVKLLGSFLRIFIGKAQTQTGSFSVLWNYHKFCLILWNNLFRHQPLVTLNISIVTFLRQTITSAMYINTVELRVSEFPLVQLSHFSVCLHTLKIRQFQRKMELM